MRRGLVPKLLIVLLSPVHSPHLAIHIHFGKLALTVLCFHALLHQYFSTLSMAERVPHPTYANPS